ncbi:MAG TPA: response regulator transcription factor [Xanthobacteraceae bacterium]|nr:response regulator transcription factor [Xanthobacteraceae bacterium]
MRLLIVEDNNELAQLLAGGLKTAGYDSDIVGRADEAKAALVSTHYAVVILDLGLPDDDGLTVLQDLRQRRNPVPVLVLTARGGVRDRVEGLRTGADDYLVKPFALDELVARVEALLRRPGQLLGSSLSLANVTFETQSRQTFVDGAPCHLSAREAAVLELLMRRKGAVVSRRLVEDHMFGFEDISSNAVEVYVHRLRKQLANAGARVKIHTMRGVGYVMAEDV